VSEARQDALSSSPETQAKLIQIWMEVLQVSRVGPHDNFLDLGGDSLSAMLCISRIQDSFGIEFDLEEFFLDQATVSAFARKIDSLHASAG
jgi:acyl carrier protein